MKFCPMCKLDLEEDNFTKNKARYDGYNSYCKSCRKHKYNKEKQNEYSINENKHNNLIWRKIPNFDKYEASSCGKIKNIKTKKIIMFNDNIEETIFNSLKDCCKYIYENNLCDKDERYIHNQIFTAIQENIQMFNYFWKYNNDNINN